MKRMKKIFAIVLTMMLAIGLFAGCGASGNGSASGEDTNGSSHPVVGDLVYESSLVLEYATHYAVDFYEGGYAYITTSDGQKVLVVPEDAEVPTGLEDDVTVLQQPIQNIYMAATAIMSLFNAIDGLDSIRLSALTAENWYVTAAADAMNAGKILYAGKYSAPDYELILNEGCELAIESTMIYHTPEVQEKLEELGIPVFVDLASYENHPLGRLEWVKLYGILIGKLDAAQEYFNEQVEKVDEVSDLESTGKTVAFFSINSAGLVTVRKTGDYVTKMIELAGGEYVFDNLTGDEESNLSTVTISFEDFYAGAMDADVLIYNSSIEGEIDSVQDLIDMNSVFSDFKAVKDGQVWCTAKNMYQATDAMADIIVDMRAIFADDAAAQKNLKFIYKLD